ncbi:unnamed protein product [Absidia cylindrospora]
MTSATFDDASSRKRKRSPLATSEPFDSEQQTHTPPRKLNDDELLEEVNDNVDYEEHPERYNQDYKKLWRQERGLLERIDGLLKDIARLTNFKGHYTDMVIPSDDEDNDNDDTQANVMTFDWESLAKEVQFNVIMAESSMATGYACSNPWCGDFLQTNGFLFIWVINNKYAKAFEMMEKWGYKYVDDITWVKQTVNRRMAKGHGYYLQHAKETCLVGLKGTLPSYCRRNVGSDVIYSERRGQSQKPEEIYELIEEMVPGGKYLEIFGRKNNLRDYWITVGNEL